MKYFVYHINDAKDIFGEDNTLSKSKQISLWGKQLIQKHIKEEKGLSFDATIEYSKEGKPFFLNNTHVHFSISHTKEYIAFCFSDNNIGIDIEQLRRVKLDIAKRFFHPKEFQYLSYLDIEDLEFGFLKIWTLKEAYVKCIGTGIADNFNTFNINLIPKLSIEGNNIKVDLFSEIDLNRGLFVSICKRI